MTELSDAGAVRSFAGAVAVVTGAAQGIGLEIAATLSSQGATTVLADIRSDRGQCATDALLQAGMQVRFMKMDVNDEGDVKSVIADIENIHGRLDILVNSAAPFRGEIPAFDDSLSVWDSNVSVLLKAPLLMAIHGSKLMGASGGGSIVNISSIVAFNIAHQPCAYHIAKAGLENLTRYLAVELGPHNIRVNAVCPGPVRGERMDRVISHRAAAERRSAADVRRDYESRSALQRLVEPDDVVHLVIFLSSAEAKNITGQAIRVCAGYGI